MKLLKIILIILIVNLVACAEPEIQHSDIAQTPVEVSCVFQNLQTAPSWVCDEPVSDFHIQGVGMAEKSAAGQNYMKDMARIAALEQLVEKLKTKTALRIKRYIGTTGMASTETIDAIASCTVKTITRKSLDSTKCHKMLTGPEGRLYVLVGLDKSATKILVMKAVKTNIISEQPLWQTFKAHKSVDEMAEKIAAMED